jgi:hypothetical protein
MLRNWLPTAVRHLSMLASQPFDLTTHEMYFNSIGWPVHREEWWPHTCFEVSFPEVRRKLVALYELSETGLGIGLHARVEDDGTIDDYLITSDAEFDAAFDETLAGISPLLKSVPQSGTYRSSLSASTHKYAYWTFAKAFLILVQHEEGDGQCGHFESLDLRLVPNRDGRISFPLTTNILF